MALDRRELGLLGLFGVCGAVAAIFGLHSSLAPLARELQQWREAAKMAFVSTKEEFAAWLEREGRRSVINVQNYHWWNQLPLPHLRGAILAGYKEGTGKTYGSDWDSYSTEFLDKLTEAEAALNRQGPQPKPVL